MCHQKDPTFLLAFTERPPFLPTFTQWPPIFNKLLVTERAWHMFVTQRLLIFAFNSQTSDNFPAKKKWIVLKFRQIWQNVEKFSAILALKALINYWCISLKYPLFLCALSLKDPPFWTQFVTERPLHRRCSYGIFICECPPRGKTFIKYTKNN